MMLLDIKTVQNIISDFISKEIKTSSTISLNIACTLSILRNKKKTIPINNEYPFNFDSNFIINLILVTKKS